jgi:hypothetical protein
MNTLQTKDAIGAARAGQRARAAHDKPGWARCCFYFSVSARKIHACRQTASERAFRIHSRSFRHCFGAAWTEDKFSVRHRFCLAHVNQKCAQGARLKSETYKTHYENK